jgi:RND family efflux transporter MFP subunit
LLLVLAFAAILVEAGWQLFEQAVPITVVRPQTVQQAAARAGAPLFQAAGWVEPDPFPIRVAALADGVVQRMLVQESDAVEVGTPLAELVADDARIALATAVASLRGAEAETQSARVERDNARAAFEAAIEVTEAVAVGRADVAGRQAELALRRDAVRQGQAAVAVAEAELGTQRHLREAGAAGPWQVELAEARLEEAGSRLSSLEAEVARAAAEITIAEARLTRAVEDQRLRLAEHRRVGLAEAALIRAEAAEAETRSKTDEARLRFTRMTVLSPMKGVVLMREAEPGSIVGPMQDRPPICLLYDPLRLRVRVDVPQTQVGGASKGQRADIRCDVRRDRPYQGEVIRVIDRADIQKVTLEVQVVIKDPDGLIKPDMLCQVTVFGEGEDATDGKGRANAVSIPSRCLVGEGTVWVVDGVSGRASRRTVEVGTRTSEEVIITAGLNPSDKVIDEGREQLEEGTPVRVRETP